MIKIFYEDTIANRIAVLPPDVNQSDYRFRAHGCQDHPSYGLRAIKGGTGGTRHSVAARDSDGPFGFVRLLLPGGQASGQLPGDRGPGACRPSMP